MFDFVVLVQIMVNIIVSMYVIYYCDIYFFEFWYVYVVYFFVFWICILIVIFGNKFLLYIQNVGMFFVIVGGIVMIIVLVVMLKQWVSNYFVWGSFDENNLMGWQGGVVFLLGVFNGVFMVGMLDVIMYMVEELLYLRRDLFIVIVLQIGLGFLCVFF